MFLTPGCQILTLRRVCGGFYYETCTLYMFLFFSSFYHRSICSHYRLPTQYDGRLCFHKCVSVQVRGGVLDLHYMILPLVPCPFQGEGYPHLHPIILLLVPCPCSGVPQWLIPGPLGGYPVPGVGGTPVLTGAVYPQPGQDEVAHSQDRMGYLLAKSGWGTPWPGQDGVPPAWSGYAVGSMPLAFCDRRTFLFPLLLLAR